MAEPMQTGAEAASPSPSTLDLETYLASYTGVTRIRRLAYIAQASAPHRMDALRMAVAEVKRSTNTALFQELVQISESLCADENVVPRDSAWVEQVDRKAAQRLEKLESDLNQHKTSLVKESIRIGHNELGDFYYERGEFSTALKCYVRTRDYCTTSRHIIAMCVNVVRASIAMGNFTHVANYVTKAESTPDSASDAALASQLRLASGLSSLEGKKYKQAARKFLEVSADHAPSYAEIASVQDVALYGGLCALASFDRAELRTKLIDAAGFRAFLELCPQVREAYALEDTAQHASAHHGARSPQVREALHDFFHSRYASCLALLDKLKPDLLLDLHLHDHVEQLYADIRSKALVQYFSPFVTVDMRLMASAFNVGVDGLEQELAKLIMAGQIKARIDSQAKVLHKRASDQRTATFSTAIKMGEEYTRDMRALLLRINLMRADFIVKGSGDAAGLGPSKSSRQEARSRPALGESFTYGTEVGL